MDITKADTIYVNMDGIGNLWIYNINCRTIRILHPWHDKLAASCAIMRVNTMTAKVKALIGDKAVQYVYNRRACSREAIEIEFNLRSKEARQ